MEQSEGQEPQFDPVQHAKRIGDLLERFRADIRQMVLNGKVPTGLLERFPDIDYGRFVASIMKFEAGDNFDPARPDETIDARNFMAAADQASEMMREYQVRYRIDSNRGYCEFKYVYFVGLSYARKLREKAEEANVGSERAGALGLASRLTMLRVVHYLTAMIDDMGLDKGITKKNLGERIINDTFDRELGEYGCYLLYKSVARAILALKE